MSTSTSAAFFKPIQQQAFDSPVLANDFRRQWDDLRAESLAAFETVGSSGWYILGDEVREFENALASWWGMDHAVGVASGLDAIEIGLRILGCGPGDKVLTTPLTAFATTLAILKLGAVPVFVDTDPYGLIDLHRVRDLLAYRAGSGLADIRFFVPVHLYGHSLGLHELRSLRDTYNIQIVEDCAQSIGATFRGQPTGSVGHVAATSFYPTKNLGAMGDGGALLTNRKDLHERAKALRDYGQSSKYRHEWTGYNSRLDELHAALLRRVSLPRLAAWTRRRSEIARAYLDGIHHPLVKVPGPPEGSQSSWHLFPLFVEPAHRNSLLAHLKASGISAGIHYPVLVPDQPALKGLQYEQIDDCANARAMAETEVSLPIHPYLTTDEVVRVIRAVVSWNP
jgi:dTDP-3-amino-3,4,6-trideoxy-alpha-D-glucose transaminase